MTTLAVVPVEDRSSYPVAADGHDPPKRTDLTVVSVFVLEVPLSIRRIAYESNASRFRNSTPRFAP